VTRFATRYAEIERLTPRRVARHAALDLLSAVSGLRAEEALARPRVQFIHLHYVFEDERDRFRALLAELSRLHTFVSYSGAVQRVLSGNIDKPYLAISFDDGLKNCLDASRVLDEFGISAMFFVCTSMVGETRYDVIREFCENRIHIPPAQLLDWDDLGDMRRRGHEVGSHSVTHRPLSTLAPDEVAQEIEQSRVTLTAHLGEVQHFAWPYGRFVQFPAGGADAVFRAGYLSCASGERGCHVPPAPARPQDVCIRREHVIARWPVRHVKYFLARSSRRATFEGTLWPAHLAPAPA
jgi:peptidoglycan/xylan/chitin deacetylase (PgdA/CDA1 family)